MPPPPETRFSPILDPVDPRSVPLGLSSAQRAFVPLRPTQNRRPAGVRHLRRLAHRVRLVGHFCYRDATLRRLARHDPLGLALARALPLDACITMDVPLYGFMTAAQVERAWAQHRHVLAASLERFPRHGIRPVPLIKGLQSAAWEQQLELLRQCGVSEAAFYARELLLEHRAQELARLVRAANRRRIHLTLLGVFTPRALRWGPATLAAQHPYVLARRRELLLTHGGRARLQQPEYSHLLHRWLAPGDVQALTSHNWLRAQRLLTPAAPLDSFAPGG